MKRPIGWGIAAATLLLVLVAPVAVGQDDDDAGELRRHPLVGAWVVSGAGQPVELITFHDDGTIRSASVVGFSVGVWEPTGRRTADATLLSPFEIEDVGFVGLGTIRGSVQVSRDGQTFSATYTIEFPAAPESESMDPLPAGQLGPVEVTGERIGVEPMGEPAGPAPGTEPTAPDGARSPAPDAVASPGTTSASPAASPAAEAPARSPVVEPSPAASLAAGSPVPSPPSVAPASTSVASPAAG